MRRSPHRFGSSIEVLELEHGVKVLVMVRKGFIDFAADCETAFTTARNDGVGVGDRHRYSQGGGLTW